MTIKALDQAVPGDIIFYAPKEGRRISGEEWVKVAQSFWSTISSKGVDMIHAGILLDYSLVEQNAPRYVAENYKPKCRDGRLESTEVPICICHNYGCEGGAQISFRNKKDLISKNQIVVISPFSVADPKEEADLRRIVNLVSICFSVRKDHRMLPSCSLYHYCVSPMLAKKNIEWKRAIAENMADFILGNPCLEKINEEGIVSYKKFFCGEMVHVILQTAIFYHRYANESFLSFSSDNPFENRKRLIKSLEYKFDSGFAGRKEDMPYWSLENSGAFVPGRLYTALTEDRSFQVGKVRLAARVLKVAFSVLFFSFLTYLNSVKYVLTLRHPIQKASTK